MTNTKDFTPDWASAPGETILHILEDQGVTHKEFANRLGWSAVKADALFRGHARITKAVAKKLTLVLGPSEAFWINRESQYREDSDRLLQNISTETALEWLKEIPFNDMKRFEWINQSGRNLNSVIECLNFFGVSSVEEWRDRYKPILETTDFRTSPTFDSNPAAVATWLRRGEIRAAEIKCEPWDPANFENSLASIRKLTRSKDPISFLPKLINRCAQCGVAVVLERAPDKCRASGAIRILPRGRRLILLSCRHLSDDQFWFTFFHESGHLLLHGNRSFIVDTSKPNSTKEEKEANDFAFNVLIPQQYHSALHRLSADHHQVIRFAKEIGISPGIVTGQLQHLGKIKLEHLNRLKRRFKWSDTTISLEMA